MNLSKNVVVIGQKLNLNKASDTTLNRLTIALGWSENRVTGGHDFDPDVSLLMLENANSACKVENFYYYNNLVSKDGEQREVSPNKFEVARPGYITHWGDNRTGAGTNTDKETIDIDLTKVPQDLSLGVITVTIFDAKERRQNFGMMDGAFIRLINADTKEELGRMDLDFDASHTVGTVFGSIVRKNGEWFFQAPNSIINIEDGLQGVVNQFNVH